jgi:hypothetical protein
LKAVDLGRYEAIVDRSGVAGRIEMLLPVGIRCRQLAVRTLLVGIMAALADDRPGHLVRVHRALVSLGDADQARLGVVVDGHRLTYRHYAAVRIMPTSP